MVFSVTASWGWLHTGRPGRAVLTLVPNSNSLTEEATFPTMPTPQAYQAPREPCDATSRCSRAPAAAGRCSSLSAGTEPSGDALCHNPKIHTRLPSNSRGRASLKPGTRNPTWVSHMAGRNLNTCCHRGCTQTRHWNEKQSQSWSPVSNMECR